MEKRTNTAEGLEVKFVRELKALLCSYAVTAVLLLGLTVLLYKTGMDEEKVAAGILAVYVISSFAGGFAAGKMAGVRKFLWGIITGGLYFVLLVLISLGIYHSLEGSGIHLLITFFMCTGGGMLGGMVS